MKRIQATNGYTIFQATARDVEKYNVTEGVFYAYFSSDVREYGLGNSYPEWEDDSLEPILEWCNSGNYAIAKEIVEASTTAATFEEIAAVEALLDAGLTADEIEEAEQAEVSVIEENGLFYVHIETAGDYFDHGPYFNRTGAELAAENYKRNTGGGANDEN